MKKILVVILILSYVIYPARVGAQADVYSNSLNTQSLPTWTPQGSIKSYELDTIQSRFKYYHEFSKLGGSIPRVIQSPLSVTDVPDLSKLALLEVETKAIQPLQIISTDQATKYTVFSRWNGQGEVRTDSLNDHDNQSYQEFPVSQSGTSEVVLRFVHSVPVTTGNLEVQFAPYSEGPSRISLKIIDAGKEEIIIADKPYQGSIRFPNHTAAVWELTFQYTQPLRMEGANFVEEPTGYNNKNYIRFLMRPGMTYRLLSKPDGYVALPYVESGDLVAVNDIISLSLPEEISNPFYRPVDDDHDGISNSTDNCPNVGNKDQVDQNKNGVGDACEDFDHDGIINSVDNCSNVPNRDQQDSDGDRIGDHCDVKENRITERLAFLPWVGVVLGFGVVIALFAITIKKPEKTTGK